MSRRKIKNTFENHAQTRIGHAEQIRSCVDECVRDIILYLGLDKNQAIDHFRMKPPDQIAAKMAQGRHTHDIVGVRILLDNTDQILHLRTLSSSYHKTRKQWEKKGIQIDSMDDYFKTPKEHGHCGLNINLACTRSRGGKHWTENAELQFMHKDMMKTYEETHPLYKIYSEMEKSLKQKGHGEQCPGKVHAMETLQSYIRARYESDCWRLDLMQLRSNAKKYAPTSKNEEEALATIRELEDQVKLISDLYHHHTKKDPEHIGRVFEDRVLVCEI